MTRISAPTGGWRLHILHETGFEYAGEASASYNEARLTPLVTTNQMVLASELRTTPNAAKWRYSDYFENQVVAFQLDEPHNALKITADSMVETSAVQDPRGSLTRYGLEAHAVTDALDEYLQPTPRTKLSAEVVDAVRAETSALSPHDAAEAISERVRALLTYAKGVTGVQTTAAEALEIGQGVCQDFTHVALAMLRSIGIPARYVSGYLHPHRDAQPGETRSGESHAWVEYFTGEWNQFDPTSGVGVGPRHVVVARGRDYRDAAPLNGIYHGAPASALGVTVTITRVR
jgi:transglutaminase-like putative cysteine protease